MKTGETRGGQPRPVVDWKAIGRSGQRGLIPAVIQDAETGEVLMVAYMNRVALQQTLKTGRTHFWSRSRRRLWKKGETSGHEQRVREIWLDCDADTLLVKVDPQGPTCHTGRWSCFFQPMRRRSITGSDTEALTTRILDRIYQVIVARRDAPRPIPGSYVSSLFAMGKDQILQKIVEEAGELVIASKNNRRKAFISEVADLWFHTLVALGYHGIAPREVARELTRRFGQPARRTRR